MKSSIERLFTPRAGWFRTLSLLGALAALGAPTLYGGSAVPSRPNQGPALADFDSRTPAPLTSTRQARKAQAQSRLLSQLPAVAISFDPLLDSPKFIRATDGFLSGANGQGRAIEAAALEAVPANDPYRPIKAFLNQHAALFGHGAEVLASARVKRDYVDAHNGLHTVAWEQKLDGLPIFRSVLLGHLTRNGELTSLSSLFVADAPACADAGTPGRADFQANPPISVVQAIQLAAQNVGDTLGAADVIQAGGPSGDGDYLVYKTPAEAYVRQVWLPLNRSALRLAWEVMVIKKATRERYQVVVDAQDGAVILRSCLSSRISNATYNVFDSDSPSPFSPSLQSPSTFQPALTNRTTITLAALVTNASPLGWIPDGGNTTTGNNVDAFVDRDMDGTPDRARPAGNPNRTFDFTLDLTTDPTNYIDASTVQLFWRANWYHDRLYQLGFTEAAGNYQDNNFGKGGLGNDHVICYVQSGADLGVADNSMFMGAPDGFNGQCLMFIFSGPTTNRDGALDSDVVIHEMTHGTSMRVVGGGLALGATQSGGLGEGWSDFYALCLLSQDGDDPDLAYASGGYASYLIAGLQENYYYGIRHFPYCTDMTKNPFTFKDIDPKQISPHSTVPRNPIYPFNSAEADEVHHSGEVWCMTLWEMHANLVHRYGWAIGNELSLQLATDGMKLTPPLPTFLEARDAIVLADQINNTGTNNTEIWSAFAKRGMGFSATSPDSSTTVGLHEAFDLPPAQGLYIHETFVSGGNGNAIIDFNECNDFFIVLTNVGELGATNVQLSLATTNFGVFLPQAVSTYPNIPTNSAATNLVAFKVSTTPSFVCGTTIMLTATIKSDGGTEVLPIRLSTGTNSVDRFDSYFPMSIPDSSPAGVLSPVFVSGLSGGISKISVSLYAQHPEDYDLTFKLIGPDNTTVVLAANHGAGGQNYGLSCADGFRTVFDDDGTNTFAYGSPPFLGGYVPDEPLASFAGKSGTNVNGMWYLQAVDNANLGYYGTLQCWSLNITSSACEDGGGQCPGVDLGIGMVDNPDPVVVDSNLVYTITVTNNGPGIARGVVVTHNLPVNSQYVSAVPSQGSASENGGVVIATLGNLSLGASATLTVTVRPAAVGGVSSTASVASTDPELNPPNNAVTIVTTVVPATADLAVGMVSTPNPTIVGGALTYTVTVTNSGPAAATQVMVTNLLPSSVTISNYSASRGSVVNLGNNVLRADIGDLAKGAYATITIRVVPQIFGTITAYARAGAKQDDPLKANNLATCLTRVGQAADLGLKMTALPDPVVVGSNLTYSVTVTNRGPNTATNVVVSQSLPAGVAVVSQTASQGTLTLSGSSLTANLGTLLRGSSASIVIVVQSTRLGALASTATVTAAQADGNSADNSATASAQAAQPFVNVVAAGATLTAESGPTNGAIDIGETVTIYFRLQNLGNVVNSNLVATLLPTGGVLNPSAAQNYGRLKPMGVPGGVPVSKPFTFTASGTPGSTLVASLQLVDGSSNLPPASFSFVLPLASKFANTNRIIIPSLGMATNYPSTITVSGVTGQVGRVTVALEGFSHGFVHDVSALLVSPAGPKILLMSHAGNFSFIDSATVTFDDTASGPMPAVGQIISGSYQPSVYSPAVTFSNPAPAGPYSVLLSDLNGLDPNKTWSLYLLDDTGGDDGVILRGWSLTLTSIASVNKLADLSLSATSSPEPVAVADTLTNVFLVVNNGPNPATGVTFSNPVPANTVLVSASTSQGNVAATDGAVVANLGSMAAGASATVTVVMSPTFDLLTNAVAAGVYYGKLTNNAYLSAYEGDLHSGDNRLTIVSTVKPQAADVGVSLATAHATVALSENYQYRLAVTNQGPGAALNVVVTNSLPAAGTYLSSSCSQGTVVHAGSELICSFGTILAGSVASALVTVNATATNDSLVTASLTTAQADPNSANDAAALTIQVVPRSVNLGVAGLSLVSESLSPADGMVDPGETVTMLVSLQNNGSVAASGVQVSLLSSGGITPLSGSQVYGAMPVGDVVARPFRFTAAGTKGGALTATFLVASSTSTNTLSVALATPYVFTLATPVVIPDYGYGAPYPSLTNLSGLSGVIGRVRATLNGLAHSFPSDVNVLLAAPSGASVLLMSHCGSAYALTDPVILTFDDDAAPLPRTSRVSSGTYSPTRYGSIAFPAPAPSAPYGASLAALNSLDPNGSWALYVFDDSAGDGGSIAGGWTVEITTINPIGATSAQAALAATVVNGSLSLALTAPASLTYAIEVTADLSNPAGWTAISTNTVPPSGAVSVVEPVGTGAEARFYRAKWLAP